MPVSQFGRPQQITLGGSGPDSRGRPTPIVPTTGPMPSAVHNGFAPIL
jgi:hypothetical protein